MQPEESLAKPGRWSLWFVDAGLLAVLFLAPLFMGGRGHTGKFVFFTCVCVAAIGWLLRMCLSRRATWRLSGVEWLPFAGLVLLLIQLTPLSESLLSLLSPSISKYLPLWTSAGMGAWSTVSLDPEATRGALVVFIGYVMLFLVLIQRLDTVADIERTIRWIAGAVLFMAVLGLAQFLFGNGKFGWMFAHPSRDTYGFAKGMFQNQNHFAHFLALGIGPLMWCLWGDQRSKTRRLTGAKQLIAVSLGLVVIAGLLTFSRGGVIAVGTALAVCAGIYTWSSILTRRSLVAVGAIFVVIAAALCIHGYEPLTRRMATLGGGGSLETISHGRAALWSALLDGIPEFAWLGTGVGSHRNVYPMFMEQFYDLEFTHGESGYLPLLLEAGVTGFALMVAGILVCGYWSSSSLLCAPSPRSRSIQACTGAVVPGIAASAVHSVGDFVWYITACMSLTVVLVACACRLYQLNRAACLNGVKSRKRSSSDSTRVAETTKKWWRWMTLLPGDRQIGAPRVVWAATLAILCIVTAFCIRDRLGPALAAAPWNDYLRLSLADSNDARMTDEAEQERLSVLAGHLERTLSLSPSDARANLRYAANCLRRFEIAQARGLNPMALSQIRDAALASQFESKQAQDAWLDVAIGKNRELLDRALLHTRRALHRSPLQGDGYIYLTSMSFLEGSRQQAKREYIAQAQLVRPHSGTVLFAAGQEAALAGDFDQAVASWKQAFQQDTNIRAVIVESFAPLVPVQFLLSAFEPDMAGLASIYHYYERSHRLDDARVTALQYAPALERAAHSSSPSLASLYWDRAHEVYAFLGQHQQSLDCELRAVELDPNSFAKRRALGMAFNRCGRFDDAVEQLQWCLRRHPDNEQLLQELASAKRDSILRQSPVAVPTANSSKSKRF